MSARKRTRRHSKFTKTCSDWASKCTALKKNSTFWKGSSPRNRNEKRQKRKKKRKLLEHKR